MNKTGQKLYLSAKKVILGGNMLLSKRPEIIYQIYGPLTIQGQKEFLYGI